MDRRLLVVVLAMAPAGCGKGTPTAQHPQVEEAVLKGVVRTNFDSPNPTGSQLARKTKSIAAVKGLGLPTIDHLPVVEDESTFKPRLPQEVAKRCVATAICAIKGETDDGEFVGEVVKKFSADPYFSPKERTFVAATKAKKQDLVDYAWRYECVHVFLWALGKRDALAAPNKICAVSEEMKIIREDKDFITSAKLRPMSEILDKADLYYRLHWAAIELRLKKKKSDAIDEGIVRERHRALNWLIRYLNQEWDDVTTDT
jgi:hypothetical protein